jgi:hypothetical protein
LARREPAFDIASRRSACFASHASWTPRLEKTAKAEGASVNTYVVAVLAASVGYKRPEK